MTRAITVMQRTWAAAVGVDEVPVTIRIWTPPQPPKRRRRHKPVHRGFRDLPLFHSRRRRRSPLTARGPLPGIIVPPEPLRLPERTPEPDAKPPKRSLHPLRVTQEERRSWVKLAPGWDAELPCDDRQCRGDKMCPGCGVVVAMWAADGAITCPECRQRVGYVAGAGIDDWYWAKAGEPGVVCRIDRIPQRALNRCRPCVRVGCPHHNYLEVDDTCGSIKLNFPEIPPDRLDLMPATCSLDVARCEKGRVGTSPKLLPLETVGMHLGLTLERARQLEESALAELKHAEERRMRLQEGGDARHGHGEAGRPTAKEETLARVVGVDGRSPWLVAESRGPCNGGGGGNTRSTTNGENS